MKLYRYRLLIRESDVGYDYYIPCVDLFGDGETYYETLQNAKKAMILELSESYNNNFPKDVISDEVVQPEDTIETIEFNEFDIKKVSPETSPYKYGDFNFVWGVKNVDNYKPNEESHYYTMNDIEISYDDEEREYVLEVETMFDFKGGYVSERKYLENCLKCFDQFMDANNHQRIKPRIMFKQLNLEMKAKTIEELYVNFKMYVKGFVGYNEEN